MLFTVCQSVVPYSCSEGTHNCLALRLHSKELILRLYTRKEDGAADRQCGTTKPPVDCGSGTHVYELNLGRGLLQLSRQQTGLQHETSKWWHTDKQSCQSWRIVAQPFFFLIPCGLLRAEVVDWPLPQPSLQELATHWLSPQTSQTKLGVAKCSQSSSRGFQPLQLMQRFDK